MKKRILLVALLASIVSFGLSASTQATTLFSDNFDSYADTAAMQAVWGASGLGVLDPNNSFSAPNSAFHPGGTVNNVTSFGTVDATATQDLVLSAKIYDDALVNNDRITVGLRGAPFPLFEMGRYNGPAGYAVRATLFSNGINANWVAFEDPNNNPIPLQAGWHSYKATFSLTGLTVELDLQSNGSVDSTLFFAGDGNPYGGFSDLRFGGPSNLSSAGGGANFDDIKLELIPEPATLTLLGLAGLGLVARRRR